MPRKRKQAEAKGLNKSKWIRSQPPALSAREVVDKAKAEGIVLTLPQVYTARSTAKRSDVAGRGGEKGGRVRRQSDLRHQFAVLATRLGTDEAQRVLDVLVSRHKG